MDIAGWIDVAEKKGHSSVVVIGHSAGGPAVRRYMAERSDTRVVGWGQASVGLSLWPPRADQDRLRMATDMVAVGHGEEFLPVPNFRLSAGTFLDYAQTPDDIYDFYGIENTAKPAVTRARAPLLAFSAPRGTSARWLISNGCARWWVNTLADRSISKLPSFRTETTTTADRKLRWHEFFRVDHPAHGDGHMAKVARPGNDCATKSVERPASSPRVVVRPGLRRVPG